MSASAHHRHMVRPAAAGMEQNPTRTSSTACQRCRAQKLKCSRERPTCVRCRRLHATCAYPAPPDRRRPRNSQSLLPHGPRRSAVATPQANNRNSEWVALSRQGVENPESRTSCPPNLQDCLARPDHLPGIVAFESYSEHLTRVDGPIADTHDGTNPLTRTLCPLPPRAAGLSLLEIFFDRVYNASLLFFKPIIFQEYVQDMLPEYLLKAIFALASLFLVPQKSGGTGVSNAEYSELRALSAFHACSLPWAKDSMKDIMSLITQEPSLHLVQGLECLTVYWFGHQDAWSGGLSQTLAYRCCRAMKYGLGSSACRGELSSPLQMELEKRCFWACWTSMCIIAQPEPYLKFAWQETAGIALPGEIKSSSGGWTVSLSPAMSQEWQPVLSNYDIVGGDGLPATASLVTIVGVWAKVQEFVSDANSLSIHERFAKLSNLSSLASATYKNVDRPTEQAFATSKDLHVLHTLDALYYMCQIALHSTAVPLFSGSSLEPDANPRDVRESAGKVLTYAERFLTLLESYWNGTFDVSHISPLVGYGAFITASVIIAYEVSTRHTSSSESQFWSHRDLGRGRHSALRIVVDLLDALRLYWRSLKMPWEKLRDAIAAMPPPATCEDTPFTTEASPQNISIAAVAQHQRFSGDASPAEVPIAGLGAFLSPSSGMSDTRPAMQQTLAGFTPVSTELDGRNADKYFAPVGQLDVDSNNGGGSEWWDLTFVEAGFAHFEGLEPVSNFRGF
ncbi:hypothetical protein IQ07DRAFT_676294 [Pyrenochaeta sp. DS3sAY3a]|nr:hypothetical protein IQ07DRAFT_676294 [Pyrenochaeta sp. DS3sAY3a]